MLSTTITIFPQYNLLLTKMVNFSSKKVKRSRMIFHGMTGRLRVKNLRLNSSHVLQVCMNYTFGMHTALQKVTGRLNMFAMIHLQQVTTGIRQIQSMILKSLEKEKLEDSVMV